jgi:hypothetical protein
MKPNRIVEGAFIFSIVVLVVTVGWWMNGFDFNQRGTEAITWYVTSLAFGGVSVCFYNWNDTVEQILKDYVSKDNLCKIVEEMRNVQKYDLNDNETTKYWADRFEELLGGE